MLASRLHARHVRGERLHLLLGLRECIGERGGCPTARDEPCEDKTGDDVGYARDGSRLSDRLPCALEEQSGNRERRATCESSLSNTDFGSWAAGSYAVTGDFNSDSLTDIALAGGPGWKTMPIAYAGSSTFSVVNVADGGGSSRFSLVTQNTGVQLLAGDWLGLGIPGLGAWNVTGSLETIASAYDLTGTWIDLESASLGLSAQYYPTTASASQRISIYPSP